MDHRTELFIGQKSSIMQVSKQDNLDKCKFSIYFSLYYNN